MEQENKNYFKTYEDWYASDDYHAYREKVVDFALDIMADAWILGTNLAWVKVKSALATTSPLLSNTSAWHTYKVLYSLIL